MKYAHFFVGKPHGDILHDGHLFLPTAIRSSTSLVGPKHLELFVARPWHKSKKFKEDVSSSKRLCQIGVVDGGWKSLQMTEKVVLKMCCAIEGRSQPTLQQKSSNLSNLPNFVPDFARIKRPCASHPVIRRNHKFCVHFYVGPAHHSEMLLQQWRQWRHRLGPKHGIRGRVNPQ